MTTGPGEKAQEILDESVSPISDALKSTSETSKISAVCCTFGFICLFRPAFSYSSFVETQLLACLAVITFVGGEEAEHTEKSMQILWQVAHPKLGANVCILICPPDHDTLLPS